MNVAHWPSETQHVVLEGGWCIMQIERVLHINIVNSP
jgi:hypothetical protein